jgi:hypothetical protein
VDLGKVGDMTLTDVGLTLSLILAVIGLAVTAVSLEMRRRVGDWPFEAKPVRRVRRQYPRGHCPDCGRGMAVTSHGYYKHKCVPVPPKEGA